MMTKAKSKYLADVIAENSDNPRRLWNSINIILHSMPPPALPEFTSVKSLCDHFSRYFVDKIETIRSKFPDKVQNIPQVQTPEIRSKMNVFERACQGWRKLLTHCFFLYLPGDYSRVPTGTRTGIVIYRHRPDPLQVESQPRRLPPGSYRRPGRVPCAFSFKVSTRVHGETRQGPRRAPAGQFTGLIRSIILAGHR